MKTLLQINVSINSGSTGRIAEEIGQKAIELGWKSYIAYGRSSQSSKSIPIKVGSKIGILFHLLHTRLFDNHALGLSSKRATKKLIKEIEIINPDIIHLHNIHGYYINVKVLFNYLSKVDIPVVWTLHDCWSFTGHCAHFEAVGCEKWKTECHSCPLTKRYPASIRIDNSTNNFRVKKRLFNSLSNLTLVPVSSWLKELLPYSFLSNIPAQTIYNGIDLSIFKPNLSKRCDIRSKYKIEEKLLLLGVASIWNDSKGLSDYTKLSKVLKQDEVIMLVGLKPKQINLLPSNVIGIERTDSLDNLVKLYSTADIVLNLSYQESFGLTTVEGLACGTPGIVYNTTASPELLDENSGLIVEAGNIDLLREAIDKIKEKRKDYYSANCRNRAELFFNNNDRFQEYIDLYKNLLD